MKKTTKNIIIALAALLVLGIAAAVLMLTAPEAEVQEESSTGSSLYDLTYLIEHDISDVENIVLTTKETGEVWTMIPTKSGPEAEANNTFTFKGWEDEEVILSDVMHVAKNFYSLTSSKEIPDVEDLAEYGLNGDGQFKGVVTYKDGTKDTVIVGYEAGETYGRYVLYNGEVHIVPMSSLLGSVQNDFIKTGLISIADNTEPDEKTGVLIPAEIQKLTLSGTNFPQTIVVQRSTDSVLYYEVAEPVFAGASSSRMDSFIAQLQSVKANGVAVVHAEEADLEEHGLLEPAAVATYELNNKKHEIRLGKKENGQYSMMVDDKDTIYLIDEASVDSWAKVSLFDVRDGFIRLANIKSVKKLTVTSSAGKDVYDITRTVNEEKSTEIAPFYDLEVTKDGKAVEYDKAYQPFYQMLLGVYLLNEDIREPEGEPILTIRYEYYSDAGYAKPFETVEFYADPENDRRCIAALNGQATGIVRASDIQSIIESQKIVGNYELLEE